MKARLLVGLLAAAGCDLRIGDSRQVDAGAPDPDVAELADAAPPDPVRIAELSTPGAVEDDPSLTGDELEIYFNVTVGIASDIYTSTRAARTDVWNPPVLVVELSSPMVDTTPYVARDGLSIFLASDRGGGPAQLWFAKRDSRAVAWPAPTLIAELASAQLTVNPTVTADGKTLVVAREATPGNLTPQQARRGSTAEPWGPFVTLAELDQPGYDVVSLSGDGMIALVASDRGGVPGSLPDLFSTERTAIDAPFQPPVGLALLNTADDDSDPWISDDLATVYFASTRSGDSDLYVAPR